METEAGHNCDQTETASEATQEERAGERQVDNVSQIDGDGDCNDQIQAELPSYPPTSRLNFTWGEIDGTTAKMLLIRSMMKLFIGDTISSISLLANMGKVLSAKWLACSTAMLKEHPWKEWL